MTLRFSRDICDKPTPLDLPAFLPHACAQLSAAFELRVLVQLQDVYVSKTAEEKTKKHKSARSIAQHTSRTFESPQKVNESGGEKPRAVVDRPDAVVALVAVYDSADRLVELAFHRAPAVPRLLLKVIALCLPFHPALDKFTVRRGPLDGVALHEIAEMLPLSQITEICLDDSPVPERNYHRLLEVPSHLRSLSLARCSLDDLDAELLAARLRHPLPASRSLRTLSLAGNGIADAGAAALAAALRGNRTLRYLNLCGNRVTDEGAGLLLGTLTEFPLTYDELISKRLSLLEHLRLKDELTRKCYGELETADRTADESSRGGRRRQTQAAGRGRRTSVERRAAAVQVDSLATKAQAMAAELLGPYSDPFGPDETVSRDGYVYSVGNTALCALNLAYNELSWASVVRLRTVLGSQERRERQGRPAGRGPGLVHAVLDGNALPAACPELAAVQGLLDRALACRLAKPQKPKLERPVGKAKSK